MNPSQHPNATAAGAATVGAVILVWALGVAGIEVPNEVGAAIAGALATIVLLIGRRGIRGIASVLWRGEGP